jgi:hypothetical protein
MAAAPTTKTTLTELVNSEFINPMIMQYAVDYTVAAPFVNWLDLRGKATAVGSFPRWILDTAGDTGETTDLTTTALETTDVQITGAEIGLRRDVTDAALQETIIGAQLFDFLVRDSGVLAAVSLDDDICALFTSFSTAVGEGTTDLDLSVMVSAQATIRKNKMRGSAVYVLDDQQAEDYQVAAAATAGTVIGGLMSIQTGLDTGYLGTFFSQPVWQTGLCDTSNTGATVNGACFIRGDTNPTAAAIGGVIVRDVTTELERNASARLTEFVMSGKWGVGETADESGVRIRTDA